MGIELDLRQFGQTHPDIYTSESTSVGSSTPPVTSNVGAYEFIALKGPTFKSVPFSSLKEFERIFGGPVASSFGWYVLKNHFDMGGGGLTFGQRIVHRLLQNAVPVGSVVSAPPNTGTANSPTAINVTLPQSSAAILPGLQIRVSNQIATVLSVVTASPNSPTNPLITLNSALPLGTPIVGASVTDVDPLTLKQSAPSQSFALDVGPLAGTALASLQIESVYDGSFYNGIGYTIKANPVVSTTLAAPAAANQSNATLTNVIGLAPGHVVKIGAGNTSGTAEFKEILALNGSVVTFTSPLTNSYAATTDTVIEQSFDLVVFSYNTQVEYWKQYSMGKNAVNYIITALNNQTGGSNYITAYDLSNANGYGNRPANTGSTVVLAGGQDGVKNPVTSASLMTDQDYIGDATSKSGFNAFDNITDFVLSIAVPGITTVAVQTALGAYVSQRQDAIAVYDPPANSTPANMQAWIAANGALLTDRNTAYYPWIPQNNPIGVGQALITVPPCGYAIGNLARTDKKRGLNKPPAGIDAICVGAADVAYRISNAEADILNPLGINCIRFIPGTGIVIFGARTLASATGNSAFAQLNVRRMWLQMEKDFATNTRWALFEPNTPALWKRLQLWARQYLLARYNGGWFNGDTPDKAFQITSDATINTPTTVNQFRTNVAIGAVPVTGAEFIFFNISRLDTGELSVQSASA